MGQQLHFETLEQIALALRNAELRAHHAALDISPQMARLEDGKGPPADLLRAEMNVKNAKGKACRVHVYESYWAPLTEGQAPLWEVCKFLLEGAGRGFWFLARERRFERWMFGGLKRLPYRQWLTALKLIAAILLVFAPVLLANFVSASQVLSMVLRRPTSRFGLAAFTPEVGSFELLLLFFFTGVYFLPKVYRAKFLRNQTRMFQAIRSMVRGFAILVSLAALAGIFCLEILSLVPRFRVWLHGIAPGSYTLPQLTVVWGVALAAGLVTRWFLIEFAGDVAIYVSGYKLSKWDEVRNKIKKSVYDLADTIYRARVAGKPGNPFLYQNIMIVGHSLGSVISYDALNQLALRDEMAAAQGRMQDFENAVARTPLFITFGSPLDKVAFLFRTKAKTDELREAAAAVLQPLIRSYEFRPKEWVNIYSWADLISGKLRFYDDPARAGGPPRVQNVPDPQAWVPLAAHTEYWLNEILGDTMYGRL